RKSPNGSSARGLVHQAEAVQAPAHRLPADAEALGAGVRVARPDGAHLGFGHEQLGGEDVRLALERLRPPVEPDLLGAAVAGRPEAVLRLADPVPELV